MDHTKEHEKESKLLAGHSTEAQVIVMGRDIERLDERLRRIEDSTRKLEALIDVIPQLADMLEARRRAKWIFKAVGGFLLAAPAVAALAQGFSKIWEWLRSH